LWGLDWSVGSASGHGSLSMMMSLLITMTLRRLLLVSRASEAVFLSLLLVSPFFDVL
jgi:serine phosphatase RsbU (regulator of sigma subunit)